MADINLRDVPDELKRLLKIDAAKQGVSLKELCLKRLAITVNQVAAVENHAVPLSTKKR